MRHGPRQVRPSFGATRMPVCARMDVMQAMHQPIPSQDIISCPTLALYAGGLGDVMFALPKALQRRGHRVMVVVPRYDNYPDAWETGVRTKFICNNQEQVNHSLWLLASMRRPHAAAQKHLSTASGWYTRCSWSGNMHVFLCMSCYGERCMQQARGGVELCPCAILCGEHEAPFALMFEGHVEHACCLMLLTPNATL